MSECLVLGIYDENKDVILLKPMSSEQLATRIIAEQSGISSERIRRGKITEDEFHRIVEVSRELNRSPCISTPPRPHHRRGRARARRLKRQRGLGLVVVDYLELLGGSAANRPKAVCRIWKSPLA